MTDLVHFDDLTKINVPFGLLDEDTKQRLRDCGGPWECYYSYGNWGEETATARFVGLAYRKKPEPPKPREVWNVYTVTGTRACTTDDRAEADDLSRCYPNSSVVRFVEAPE